MAGGLFDPLGADRPTPRRRPGTVPLSMLALAAAGAALVALAAYAALRDDGARGRPVVAVPIEHVAAPPAPAPPAAAPAAAPAPREDQDVEVQNGVRIVRPRRSPAAASSEPAPSQVVIPPAAPR